MSDNVLWGLVVVVAGMLAAIKLLGGWERFKLAIGPIKVEAEHRRTTLPDVPSDSPTPPPAAPTMLATSLPSPTSSSRTGSRRKRKPRQPRGLGPTTSTPGETESAPPPAGTPGAPAQSPP